jgi:hypothetical protein
METDSSLRNLVLNTNLEKDNIHTINYWISVEKIINLGELDMHESIILDKHYERESVSRSQIEVKQL